MGGSSADIERSSSTSMTHHCRQADARILALENKSLLASEELASTHGALRSDVRPADFNLFGLLAGNPKLATRSKNPSLVTNRRSPPRQTIDRTSQFRPAHSLTCPVLKEADGDRRRGFDF